MENKIIQGIEELQVDVKDAKKQMSNSMDKIIADCEEISLILKSMINKLDQISTQD